MNTISQTITKPVRSREHSGVNYIIESRDNIKLMKIKEMVNKTGREMSISFIFNSIKLMCKTIHESFYNLPGDDMGFPFGTTR